MIEFDEDAYCWDCGELEPYTATWARHADGYPRWCLACAQGTGKLSLTSGEKGQIAKEEERRKKIEYFYRRIRELN